MAAFAMSAISKGLSPHLAAHKGLAVQVHRTDQRPSTAPGSLFLPWLIVFLIFCPSTVNAAIGGIKFTPARVLLLLLFVPAILRVARHRFVAADFFMFAAAIWMFVAAGGEYFQSTSSDALECLGGYMIGRAYLCGDALQQAVKALKLLVPIFFVFALLDVTFKEPAALNFFANIFGETPRLPVERIVFGMDVVRAQSTFDHPILYGTFCVLSGTILLYFEPTFNRRCLYLVVCAAGILLTVSAAALAALIIVVALRIFDYLMNRYSWRWKLVTICIVSVILVSLVVSNDPVGWLINHTTFDVESGFYRLLIWQSSLAQLSLSPMTGIGFNSAGIDFISRTIDCVWLVQALRYGVPQIVFLLAVNVAAFWPPDRRRSANEGMKTAQTAFTLTIVMFAVIGLSVDYWNSMWIFWFLCLGIRSSLKDRFFIQAKW